MAEVESSEGIRERRKSEKERLRRETKGLGGEGQERRQRGLGRSKREKGHLGRH